MVSRCQPGQKCFKCRFYNRGFCSRHMRNVDREILRMYPTAEESDYWYKHRPRKRRPRKKVARIGLLGY